MSVSIYTVQVIIPYETFGEIKSFTSLDEAREFFNTIIKVQTWKCTVYLKGPIKLPYKFVISQTQQRGLDSIKILHTGLTSLIHILSIMVIMV